MQCQSRALLRNGEPDVPKSTLPKGMHRVRRKVVSRVRYHFYAWRGGPKFWEGTVSNPNGPEFFHASTECEKLVSACEYPTSQLVDDSLRRVITQSITLKSRHS